MLRYTLYLRGCKIGGFDAADDFDAIECAIECARRNGAGDYTVFCATRAVGDIKVSATGAPLAMIR